MLSVAEMQALTSGARREETDVHMIAVLDSDWAVIIVVAAVVVFFGGGKLPKLFHSLGSAQAEFKKGLAEGDAPANQVTASDVPPSTTPAPVEAAPSAAASPGGTAAQQSEPT